MPAVELVLAYPGVWLATGYLRHAPGTTSTAQPCGDLRMPGQGGSERLTAGRAGATARWTTTRSCSRRSTEPIYRVTQSRRAPRLVGAAKATVRAYETAAGSRGRGGPRRAGRAGLGAMAQVVDGLDRDARYVNLGHLHTPGPADGDAQTWTTRSGTRLVNCGAGSTSPPTWGRALRTARRGPERWSLCVTRVRPSCAGCCTASPERSFALGRGDTAQNRPGATVALAAGVWRAVWLCAAVFFAAVHSRGADTTGFQVAISPSNRVIPSDLRRPPTARSGTM